jgi:hypothetical protein
MHTTKKGNARKGQPKGARLAYDDTKKTKCTSCHTVGKTSMTWLQAIRAANKKLGTNETVPRKGSKVYLAAKKMYGK